MAKTPDTTALAVWNTTLAYREEIMNALGRVPNRRYNEELEQRLAEVEDQILSLAPPDLDGVIMKLQLMWSEELHGEDQASRQKLGIMADLLRLSAI